MIFGLNHRLKKLFLTKDVLAIFMVGSLFFASASSTIFKNKEYIITDGLNTKKVTTFHGELKKILELANIRLDENDKLFIDNINPITTNINIKRAIAVEVLVDGTEKKVQLPVGSKVEDALKKLEIQLGEEDVINIPKDSLIDSESRIIIERVETKTRSFKEDIPFEVEKRYDDSLRKGETRLERKGVNGIKEITVKEKFINGKLKEDLTQKTESIVSDPLNQIEVIGTKVERRNHSSATPIISFSSNVTHDPKNKTFVDHEGKTVKYDRIICGPVTGYSPDEKGDCGIGSTGVRVQFGHCAVNPENIPYGTLLYIPGYGYAEAVDTGGAMLRRRNPVLIDLRFNNINQANSWGRRIKEVFVIKR